jgi:hypothetical protein
LPIVVLASLALVTLPVSPANASCKDLLDNNTYQCTVKDDSGDKFDDCFAFTTPGEQSEDVDLFSEALGSTLSCDCKAGGGFRTPKFGQSDAFHCVTTSEAGLGLAFDSKIKQRGRRLLGEAVSEAGMSFVFRCDRKRTCSLAQAAERAPAPSW